MRTAILMLASLVLAGCAGSEDPAPAGNHTAPAGGDLGAPAAASGSGGAANHAPTGGISASIERGQVPVQVTFDLVGLDADGDELTWNLDLDGDGNTDKSGDTLPASEAYNYTSPGSFNVTFSLSDGEAQNTYAVTIDATGAAGGSGPVQEFSGSWTGGPYGCGFRGLLDDQLSGIVGVKTDVNPDSNLKPASAHFVATAPSTQFTLWYQDAEGGALEGGTGGTLVSSQSPSADYTWEGEVPDGAAFMTFVSCGGGPTTVTYTAG